MITFDRLIRPSMTVRDVRREHPETVPVFDEMRIRHSCYDCSVDAIARREGLETAALLDRLNRASFPGREAGG